MDLGIVIVRVIVGVLLVGHGTQKLFGWVGGDGPGTGRWSLDHVLALHIAAAGWALAALAAGLPGTVMTPAAGPSPARPHTGQATPSMA
jgi:putative oxidoreductase